MAAKRAPKKLLELGRKGRVFSFQADPDVAAILADLDQLPRGEKSRQINEALRLFLSDAERMVLLQEIADRKARLEQLSAKRR
jgi:hypothetical protein